jgi:hypothetical protein
VILYQLFPETLFAQSADHEPPVTVPLVVTTALELTIDFVVAEVDEELRSLASQFATTVLAAVLILNRPAAAYTALTPYSELVDRPPTAVILSHPLPLIEPGQEVDHEPPVTVPLDVTVAPVAIVALILAVVFGLVRMLLVQRADQVVDAADAVPARAGSRMVTVNAATANGSARRIRAI